MSFAQSSAAEQEVINLSKEKWQWMAEIKRMNWQICSMRNQYLFIWEERGKRVRTPAPGLTNCELCLGLH